VTSNNFEIHVINMGPELARAEHLGFSASSPAKVCHSFFVPSGELADLNRRLRDEGFLVAESDTSPAVMAARDEPITFAHMRTVVRDMCDLADKFAAEYDGWKIDA
jgi:hypothetical protein